WVHALLKLEICVNKVTAGRDVGLRARRQLASRCLRPAEQVGGQGFGWHMLQQCAALGLGQGREGFGQGFRSSERLGQAAGRLSDRLDSLTIPRQARRLRSESRLSDPAQEAGRIAVRRQSFGQQQLYEGCDRI